MQYCRTSEDLWPPISHRQDLRRIRGHSQEDSGRKGEVLAPVRGW